MPFKRYVHSPVTLEHNGINASISSEGKIILSKEDLQTHEFDEIEIPASLVFKLAAMLRATRKIKYVDEPYNHNNNDDKE